MPRAPFSYGLMTDCGTGCVQRVSTTFEHDLDSGHEGFFTLEKFSSAKGRLNNVNADDFQERTSQFLDYLSYRN